MLYQRYFLRTNQAHMTHLLAVLVGLCLMLALFHLGSVHYAGQPSSVAVLLTHTSCVFVYSGTLLRPCGARREAEKGGGKVREGGGEVGEGGGKVRKGLGAVAAFPIRAEPTPRGATGEGGAAGAGRPGPWAPRRTPFAALRPVIVTAGRDVGLGRG